MNSKEIEQQLIVLLKGIYDDDNFITGIISILPWDDERNKLISFMNRAEAEGGRVSSDLIYAVSLRMKREKVANGGF